MTEGARPRQLLTALIIAIVATSVLGVYAFQTPVLCNSAPRLSRSLVSLRSGSGFSIASSSPAVGKSGTGQADAGSDVVGNVLYVVGGYGQTGSDKLDAVSLYNYSSRNWTDGPSYPLRAWGLACAAIERNLYCFGGAGAGLRAYKLDTVKGVWGRLKDMPSGYRDSQGHVAIADALNNRIFIMGSSSNRNVSRNVWSYSIQNDTYLRKRDMPVGNGWFTAALYLGKIFTIGGTHGNCVFVYDTSSDTWTQSSANLPGPARYGMVRDPGVVSGLVPVIDGHDGTTFYDLTYFYDVSKNSFEAGPDTLIARDGIFGGIIGTTLYVGGGRDIVHSPLGLTFFERLDFGQLQPKV